MSDKLKIPTRAQVIESGLFTREWIRFFLLLRDEIIASEDIGIGSPTALTISGGAVTISKTNRMVWYTIDTEDGAATDDLDTINGGSPGQFLLIQPADSGRTVVCKNSAVLPLQRQSDFAMNNVADSLFLVCLRAGIWKECGGRVSAGD